MRLASTLSFLLVLATAGTGRAQEAEDLAGYRAHAAELRGERVYARACAACHGRKGDGDGPGAAALDPRPRNFTSGTFKFRSTPSGALPTDEDLIRTVEHGVPNTSMPAWEDLLSAGETRDVVAFIKTFSERFEDAEPATPITIPPAPEATARAIADGKNLYVIMQCWTCHGVKGRGNGEAAGTLTDEWGAPIRAYDFTGGTYKAGGDSQSIYRTLNTGLTGTPMPSYADVFLFGGDAISDLRPFEAAYTGSEITALRTYLESQPSGDELDEMSETELEAIAARRKWSLVHYIQSLSRDRGLFYRLFVEDTELTR